MPYAQHDHPKNVYDLDLQHAREIEHNNNLYQNDRLKWYEKDPKKLLINICEYFDTIRRSCKAPLLYMLCQHIVPLVHKSLAYGYSNSDKMILSGTPSSPSTNMAFIPTWLIPSYFMTCMTSDPLSTYWIMNVLC